MTAANCKLSFCPITLVFCQREVLSIRVSSALHLFSWWKNDVMLSTTLLGKPKSILTKKKKYAVCINIYVCVIIILYFIIIYLSLLPLI